MADHRHTGSATIATTRTVALGRRLVVATALAFVALLAIATFSPPVHAIGSQTQAPSAVPASYTGWIKVRDAMGACVRSPCPLTQVNVYHWSGRGWHTYKLPTSTKVYVSPYGSGYHWAWTSSGWMAIRTSDLAYTRPVY